MNAQLVSFLIGLLEITWIDLVLSGDNAVVIALACRSLPAQQRMRGIILGCSAAIGLRIALTFGFLAILTLPYIKLIGGLLLLGIAIKLAIDGESKPDIAPAPSIWIAIRTIVIADALMSLDNVVAVTAAAKGSLVLIIFGTLLSVPLIIFGSALLINIFARYPMLVWIGAALLGFIAGELASSEPVIARLIPQHADLFVAEHSGILCGLAGLVFVLFVAFVFHPRSSSGKAELS